MQRQEWLDNDKLVNNRYCVQIARQVHEEFEDAIFKHSGMNHQFHNSECLDLLFTQEGQHYRSSIIDPIQKGEEGIYWTGGGRLLVVKMQDLFLCEHLWDIMGEEQEWVYSLFLV